MLISAYLLDEVFDLFEGNSGGLFPLREGGIAVFPVGNQEVVAAGVGIIPFLGDALGIRNARLQASCGRGSLKGRAAETGLPVDVLLQLLDERGWLGIEI